MRRRTLIGTAAAAAVVLTIGAIGVLGAFGVPLAWARWTGQTTFEVTSPAGALRSPGPLSTAPRAADANDPAIVLTWAATEPSSGTVDPTGYRIERQATDETAWHVRDLPVSCATGTCRTTDTTTRLDTSYRYRVTSRAGTAWVSAPAATRLSISARPRDARVVPGTFTLESVAAAPSSRTLVAVGTGGTILVCNGSCTDDARARWAQVASPTSHDLHRVVFAADGRSAWAVGDAGTLLTCPAACTSTTGRWSVVDIPGVTADLYGVFVTGDYLVAVGAHGVARYTTNLSSRARTWADLAFAPGAGPGTRTLYAVAGQSARSVAVVGAGGFAAGRLLRSGGSRATCGADATGSWLSAVALSPATGTDLRDVAAIGDRYYAVGSQGSSRNHRRWISRQD